MAKILLGVSGSVSAYKACDLVSKLVQKGHEVRVVLTSSAQHFLGDSIFEGLTRSPVLSSGFEKGNQMAHIHWARWADLILVYPASANRVNQMASGLANDLLGMIFLAQDFSNFWIAPAMNPKMLAHPATQESLKKLKSWGVQVLEGESGWMACGEEGEGRLIEPQVMVEKVESSFKSRLTPLPMQSLTQPKKILITAGGTSEKIDPVRVLTNTSTGETGVFMADELSHSGNQVTLLLSEGAYFLPKNETIQVLRFSDFQSLNQLLQSELGTHHYDSVIHAAAVSDYSVDQIQDIQGKKLERTSKISSGKPIRLVLKPNPKLLSSLKSYSKNKKIQVISFKLTTTEGEPDLSSYSSDYVVHNSVQGLGRGTSHHRGEIYSKDQSEQFHLMSEFQTKAELVQTIRGVL